MLLPAVVSWCKSVNLPPSRFLIPLSYASILGGTCSLIGTRYRINAYMCAYMRMLCVAEAISTNLVAYSLAQADSPDLELPLFEIGIVGGPLALAGLIYTVVFSRWLLPVRQSASAEYKEHPREYEVAALIAPSSSLIGKTVGNVAAQPLALVTLFR